MTAEWYLYRNELRVDRTIGGLWFVQSEKRICYTLEDVVRPFGALKVLGETAIPAGRYRVDLTWSDRFGWLVPEILGVPDFSGIRFHGGERPADTKGCPLVGMVRDIDEIHHTAPAKKLVCERVLNDIRHFVETWVTVVNGPHPSGVL